MSHFVTLVIISGDTPLNRIEQTVEDLLEPYSVHLTVAPYEDECGCIGFKAMLDVKAEIEKTFNLEAMRREFNELPECDQTEERWKQMVAPVDKKRQELFLAHPLHEKPNPECNDCKGTGKFMTRYNPSAKWDYWAIGGRWSEWIFGPEREKAAQEKNKGCILCAETQELKNNCRPLSEIPLDDPHYIPFAVLTPQGEWIEQGEMGWWAVVNNGKEFKEWHELAKSVLEKYPEHLAVAVDCHV